MTVVLGFDTATPDTVVALAAGDAEPRELRHTPGPRERPGHASRLLEWILVEARRLGCEQVHLDSAPHRHPAHRLYLNEGYQISSFHFSRNV